MAENNLSSKEQMLHDYMKELMKTEFPDVDLSDSGAFMEMFGSPHIDLLTPLVTFADRITLMQSIENASLLTSDEMDQVAARYYTNRDVGSRASGFVLLLFSDIPVTGILNIPAGVRVLSKTNLGYQSMRTVTLSQDQLSNYYDPDLFRYKVPVQMEAEGTGEEYNAEVGAITVVGTALDFLEGAYNDVSITGGRNAESNQQLAEKIGETAFAPNMGVNRGYVRFIKSFLDVEDVLIAGYGHPLMQRDVIGQFTGLNFINQTVKDVHWGTKIDIYLRGKKMVDHTEFLTAERDADNKFILKLSKKPVHDVLDIKLYTDANQQEDPDIDESTLYISKYVVRKNEDFETEGTLLEESWVELNDPRVTEDTIMRIRYRYNGLLEDIHARMYDTDERPPTADVKLKEANRKFVYGSLVVKMKSPLGIRERDKSWVRQTVYHWVDEIGMGQEIQFSDVTVPLTATNDATIDPSTLVDYIRMPYQFTVFENDNKFVFYSLNKKQREVMDFFQAEQPALYTIFEKYASYVTTQDFFDILHAFSFDGGMKKALPQLDYLDYEWGRKVATFKSAKELLSKSLVANRLTPSVHVSGENEYFELGDLNIYEDREYSVDEWKNFIQSIHEIASLDQENADANEVLRLVVYCVVVIYLLTAEENLLENRSELYQFLSDLVNGTPISYEFNR